MKRTLEEITVRILSGEPICIACWGWEGHFHQMGWNGHIEFMCDACHQDWSKIFRTLTDVWSNHSIGVRAYNQYIAEVRKRNGTAHR